MPVVISNSLVLSDSISGGGVINANNPIFGWQNLVTTSNLFTTTEDPDFPADNLANPSTNLEWHGLISSPQEDEYITIMLNTSEDVDYVGIARHNFGSAQITVSIEGLTDSSASPVVWAELVQESIPANDQPLLFRFTPQPLDQIRVRLQPGTAAPEAAVVYAGKLLVMQRRLYVGHTPSTYGRSAKIINARSEAGDFLGRIVLNEMTKTSAAFTNLTPDWSRINLVPFISDSRENPFFFSWRPGSYPAEVGYLWMTNDPQLQNQSPNGLMQVSFDMTGIFE